MCGAVVKWALRVLSRLIGPGEKSFAVTDWGIKRECLLAFNNAKSKSGKIYHALTCVLTLIPTALDCDFESDDLCGFTFDLSAQFNWTRSNFTRSANTGPSSDHTHGDGKCSCISSSDRLRSKS